jgi:hypothetical protein
LAAEINKIETKGGHVRVFTKPRLASKDRMRTLGHQADKFMKQKDHLVGELLFPIKDGGRALVWVYRCNHTFTLRRIMHGGRTEERTKSDPYNGDLSHYVSEAMLVWSDLELDGVEMKPRF